MQEVAKFEPLKAALEQLKENVSKTVVSITDNKLSYDLLKENKKILQERRIEVEKYFKAEKVEYLAYQKLVTTNEKEALGIIKPLEDEITARIKQVDELAVIEKRKASYPVRVAMLEELGLVYTEEQVLSYSDEVFAQYIMDAKLKKLEDDRLSLEADRKKLEDEKIKVANDIRIEKEKADAVAKAIADEKAKAIIDKIALEKAEKLQEEANKKNATYKKWLEDNDFKEDGSFIIKRYPNDVFVMYKKISLIKIEI